MPFPQQPPRFFTRLDVQTLWPNQFGCYGIYRQGCWIYVGKGDIRQRLLDHLNGDIPCIIRQQPTNWVSVVTPYYDDLEKRLINELQPVCNQRVG